MLSGILPSYIISCYNCGILRHVTKISRTFIKWQREAWITSEKENKTWKKWSRIANVEKAKEEKQRKWSDNIPRRNKDKKMNKFKEAAKTGNFISEF